MANLPGDQRASARRVGDQGHRGHVRGGPSQSGWTPVCCPFHDECDALDLEGLVAHRGRREVIREVASE
jgi:hypothetical protein